MKHYSFVLGLMVFFIFFGEKIAFAEQFKPPEIRYTCEKRQLEKEKEIAKKKEEEKKEKKK